MQTSGDSDLSDRHSAFSTADYSVTYKTQYGNSGSLAMFSDFATPGNKVVGKVAEMAGWEGRTGAISVSPSR